MTPTTMPMRKHALPIERLAGVAAQFEPSSDGYLFRRGGCGPAVPVTTAEHAALAKAGNRALLLHLGAFGVCCWAAWLAVARALPGSSDLAMGAVVGIVVSAIGLVIYGSLRWHADAPARAVSGRRATRPARAADFGGHPGYWTIVLWMAVLSIAVVARPQPLAFNVALTIFGLVCALFVAGRRWLFARSLTSGQRAHARQAEKHERRADTPVARRRSLGIVVLLLLFFVLELVALAAGILLSVQTAAALIGRPAGAMPDGAFLGAVFVGFAVGGLFMWPVDRLCKRWTGESVFSNFDFLAGW